MILRIRFHDGTMQKIQIPPGKEDEITLAQALSPFQLSSNDNTIQIGSDLISNVSQTLSMLKLKHGSLIALGTKKRNETKISQTTTTPTTTTTTAKKRGFDPYPELAKDYTAALRTKTRRRGGMTYGDLALLQSSLHIVEPQPKGPIERIYMCRISAERFIPTNQPRMGLLLGTIAKERLDTRRPNKQKTSLSSTTSTPEYCQVAKVQAIWESPTPPLIVTDRIRQLAQWLDMIPLGWIFTHADRETPPVHGQELYQAASLQITQMQQGGTSSWITLTKDATTGATEAFQLSNVAVQMVAEGMMSCTEQGRFVPTQHAIVVDGKETTTLDTVLCLINTAMLAHEGKFAGGTLPTVKKNGMMLTKTKKALLAAIESTDHCHLLNALCDFNVLAAIDQQMKPDQMEALCQVVKKWAKGQKIGTQLSPQLKVLLKGILNQ